LAFDPLSRSTRSSKRLLLVAVVLAFVIDIFHIGLTDIPLGGIETRVDPGVLPLLIFVIVLYFTIAFGIAIYDDVVNTPTPHVLETYNTEVLTRLYAGMSKVEKDVTEYLSERGVARGTALRIARNLSFHAKNMFPSGLSREAIEQIVLRPLDAGTREGLTDAGIDVGRLFAELTAPLLKDYRHPRIGAYLQFFYARLYGFELALPATLALATLYLYFHKIDLAWLNLFSGGTGAGA
jgi:hypothetical protein